MTTELAPRARSCAPRRGEHLNHHRPRSWRKPLTAGGSTPDEGVALFACRDLHALGRAAHAVTLRLHPEPYRTYNIDRNINYTNVCAAVCDFCAFYRKSERRRCLRPAARGALPEDRGDDRPRRRSDPHAGRHASVAQARVVRGTAPRPARRAIRSVNLHAFSPPEIWHFHKLNKLPLREVLQRLKDAGWAACPAAAAKSSSIASARS